MKTPDTKFIAYVSVIAICILGTLSGTLICASNFFANSKYSFVALIMLGVGIIVYNIMKRLDNMSDKAISEKQKALDELIKANAEKANALKEKEAALNNHPNFEDIELLKKKCDAIEEFRNSFPYVISDGYILYNIIRTEICPGSHSRWLIVGQNGENLWAYGFIRPDTQTYKELLNLAKATNTPQELEDLDQSSVTLWK